jgi:phosphatidylinositol dimannoside acyltransferase
MFRHFLSWKPLFYNALLPALRLFGPRAADSTLARLGRIAAVWPPRRAYLTESIARARDALDDDWDVASVRRDLGANLARFQARDYLLDVADDNRALASFDVHGFEHLKSTLAQGRGAIVLGSHLGAYLAGLHWILRRGVPLRLLVQKPGHVSHELRRRLDRSDGPNPQSQFYLRRGLPPGEAAARMLRARDALRSGLAVYLSGDVPWKSANARQGRLVGVKHSFLSVWTDLAIVSRAPVVPFFCSHLPGGRFSLRFDPPWEIATGGQQAAVDRYLTRVEDEIRARPDEAVAHLTWPCYQSTATSQYPSPTAGGQLPHRLLKLPGGIVEKSSNNSAIGGTRPVPEGR